MTPLLWPVWCAAILSSFSRTTTESARRALEELQARGQAHDAASRDGDLDTRRHRQRPRSPRSWNDTTRPRPITRWSFTSMPISRPAAAKRCVVARSSGEGSGSPEGWLWYRMTPAAPARIAWRKSGAGATEAWDSVPRNSGGVLHEAVLRVEEKTAHDLLRLAGEALDEVTAHGRRDRREDFSSKVNRARAARRDLENRLDAGGLRGTDSTRRAVARSSAPRAKRPGKPPVSQKFPGRLEDGLSQRCPCREESQEAPRRRVPRDPF